MYKVSTKTKSTKIILICFLVFLIIFTTGFSYGTSSSFSLSGITILDTIRVFENCRLCKISTQNNEIYDVIFYDDGKVEIYDSRKHDVLFQRNKITPLLQEKLDKSNDSEKIPVSIVIQDIDQSKVNTAISKKFNITEIEDGSDVSLSTMQSYVETKREISKAEYTLHNKKFIDSFAKQEDVLFSSSYSPFMILTLCKEEIKNLVSSDIVLSIDCFENAKLEKETAKSIPNIRANVTRDTLGLKGNGVKIGTIEAENTYLNKSNSQLYDRNIIFDIPDSQAVTDNHSTLVAAIIIGRTQGLVPNATLYCAGMVTYLDMFNKVEWLISQGVSVINMSAGTPTGAGTYTTEARWLDHLAIQHSVHFVKSAGNDIGYITNPGMAYNIVTVGAIDDNNSASEPYWPDDSMADFSSYMENTGIAFKPDLTAPGEDISAGGITNKGTSFAAPHVTGVIAQLIHAYPQLATKQTAMKAILAAGTKHKTATDYGCYSAITAYSNMEGAGVVDAQSAYYIAANSRYYSGQLYNSSFPFEKTFTVTSSDSLIRVSLVWLKRINISSPHPTGTVTERPLSDLDLRVYDPNGSCVKLSVTGNSNVELVEFVPQMTGTYKIIVNGYSLKNDFEYIGIAWF